MRHEREGIGEAVAHRAIGAYQALRAGRPTSCRFYPSCSAYADEAIRVHGLRRGLWLAARRLSRCHPFGRHGVDAVPPVNEGMAR